MQLKRSILAPCLLSLFGLGLFAAPKAGSAGLAAGIFLGQPTGITVRYGLGHEQSVEAKAAWSFAGSGSDARVTLQANWLMEFPGILVVQGLDFPLYAGAGLQADLGNQTGLGFRVPLGLLYRFAKAPIELNREIGLGLQLIPSTVFSGSGGLGIRYRF